MRERSESARETRRDGLAIGAITGMYALSFGAISVAAGLSIVQTCVLSLAMFTGASQYAFVGLLGGGASAFAGVPTAVLLGLRNGLYGLRLSPLLRTRGPRRLVAAQLVIDESTALALGAETEDDGRLGFWTAGLAVYVCWNVGTLVGALGARALPDPGALGLDAAVPAVFLALLSPRLRDAERRALAGAAALLALVTTPVVPAGVPVLLAAVLAVAWGLLRPVEERLEP